MQSNTLQNELQAETESRTSATSETDETHDMTVVEQQISNLGTECM